MIVLVIENCGQQRREIHDGAPRLPGIALGNGNDGNTIGAASGGIHTSLRLVKDLMNGPLPSATFA